MKKLQIRKVLPILLSSLLLLSSCSSCSKKDILQLQAETKLYSDSVINYLTAMSEPEQVRALTSVGGNYADKQTLKLSWLQYDGASRYRIIISENKKLTNPYEFYTTDNELVPGILTPGTKYYVQVYALDGQDKVTVSSSVKTFSTSLEVPVRIVNIDGVTNVRDMGGWTANGDSQVKYGMVYRGAHLESITDAGIDTFAKNLKIKTEIDVRTDGEQDCEIEGVSYKRCGIWQYSMIIPGFHIEASDNPKVVRNYDYGSPDGIKAIFNILADEKNYPVYFHCYAGADRTGTFAYLLNGLLGVSYDNLIRDFELTSFSINGARYRGQIIDQNFFSKNGIMMNTTSNLVCFGDMNSRMIENYGKEGKLLSYAIENYLLTVCEVQQETINKVRNIMLEKSTTFEKVELDDFD